MACSSVKTLQVVFYQRTFAVGSLWCDRTHWDEVKVMLDNMVHELEPMHIELTSLDENTEMVIHGYGDILNSIRLRYPGGGFPNVCLGHVLGASSDCDLLADLRRGINRLLFAPETVEPQGSDKIVCHNCGCGC